MSTIPFDAFTNTSPEPLPVALADAATKSVEPIRFRRIAVCVDGSPYSQSVIAHGARLASALNEELTLLRVIEPATVEPLDPVTWDIRVRQGREDLEQRAGKLGADVRTAIIEGSPAEQIRTWTRANNIDLTVFASHGESGPSELGLGGTARKLVERIGGSLFLVPVGQAVSTDIRYRKILVPLDGSSHAESVLSLAAQLADGASGIVLAHVVPSPELTETAPMDSETIELRDRLVKRNRRVAEEYLQRVRAQVSGDVSVRMSGQATDVRSGLDAIIADERPDLVVLSGYGRGRRPGVPFGTVAGHLMARTRVPLLLVRGRQFSVARAGASPARLPAYAGR